MPQIEIYKTYETVSEHLTTVREYADQFKKELGFLPFSAYEEQALKGRLWIAAQKKEKNFVGHLMFGGTFPSLKITQMFVEPESRNKGIATKLLKELENYGEENSYLSITARVAEDLPANKFWELSGFKTVQKKEGGKTTKRIINIRSKELNTPSLLTLMEIPKINTYEKLSYKNKPISSTPLYAIDLNIIFDIIKNRPTKKEARAVITAALNNKINMCVTDEFITELERNTYQDRVDPILEFSKELQILKGSDSKKINALVPQLRKLVFPDRKLDGRSAKQDYSDLQHLAKAISNNADGFVTREKAILRAGKEIFQQYSLEIIPPVDFLDPTFDDEAEDTTTVIDRSKNQHFNFSYIQDQDLIEIENFLKNREINESFSEAISSPTTSSNKKRRWCVRINKKLVGVASWIPPKKVSRSATLHIFVDEDQPSFSMIVDHIFEKAFQNSNKLDMFKVSLNIGPGQAQTKALAIQRGFRTGVKKNTFQAVDILIKIVCSGVIRPEAWSEFSDNYRNMTGLSLPNKMPEYKGEGSLWITVEDDKQKQNCEMSLFEFETLVSPAIFLCPKRNGLIIPIQQKYAAEIGIINPTQLCLLPKFEAILHTERAYFRSNTHLKKYSKGMPIIFYVSKTGEMSQHAVGCARITYSNDHSIDEVNDKFYRQGVLSKSDLEKIASKNGRLHVFTFDNFNRFKSPVPHHLLKSTKLISKANLVTAEKITSDQISKIISLSFEE